MGQAQERAVLGDGGRQGIVLKWLGLLKWDKHKR